VLKDQLNNSIAIKHRPSKVNILHNYLELNIRVLMHKTWLNYLTSRVNQIN